MGEMVGENVAIIDNHEEWITSKTGKRYRLLERDGRRVREYESGALLDDETKKIVQPIEDKLFTREKALAAISRKEKIKEEAVVRALSTHGGGDPGVGIEKLAKVQVQIASKEDSGHNATRAFKELLQAGGYIQGRGGSNSGGGNGSAAEHLNPELLRLAERVLVKMDEILDKAAKNDPIITTDKGTNHELLTDGGDDGG